MAFHRKRTLYMWFFAATRGLSLQRAKPTMTPNVLFCYRAGTFVAMSSLCLLGFLGFSLQQNLFSLQWVVTSCPQFSIFLFYFNFFYFLFGAISLQWVRDSLQQAVTAFASQVLLAAARKRTWGERLRKMWESESDKDREGDWEWIGPRSNMFKAFLLNEDFCILFAKIWNFTFLFVKIQFFVY